MSIAPFEYHAPRTIEEAVALLNNGGKKAFAMAGGTDLLIKARQKIVRPAIVVALKKIKGLNRIAVDKDQGLTIGATALLSEVAAHPLILERYPAVAEAAAGTANVQIRNMGTVVGNLCNASPSADNAPTLVVMEARLHITGPDGSRTLPLQDFFKGPGLTALNTGEIVTAVQVPPPPPNAGTSYRSLSARGAVDCAAVCVAAMVVVNNKRLQTVRLCVGACASTPVRTPQAETLLAGKTLSEKRLAAAADQASRETLPISDVRASSAYRRHVVSVLVRRAVVRAVERAQPGDRA